MRTIFQVLLVVWSLSALGADVRTPTQEGIVYGVADGQQLTMDYYAPKGPGAASHCDHHPRRRLPTREQQERQ